MLFLYKYIIPETARLVKRARDWKSPAEIEKRPQALKAKN
jgi:hypothetical protein